MGKYFSLGEYDKRYKFLWIYLVFRFLNQFIFDNRFVFEQLQPDLLLIPQSPFIYFQFYYLTFIIISFILILIKKFRKLQCCRENTFIEELIFNELGLENYAITNADYFLFLNIGFVVIVDLLNIFINEIGGVIFNFWMFDMFFYYLFHSRLFKTKIYKHHIFSLIFILSFCILLKIISIILSFSPGAFYDQFFEGIRWLIPIGIIASLLKTIFSPFIFSYEKYYLEKKIISIKAYLLIYGIFGLILSSICATLSSYIPCSEELSQYFCVFEDDEGNFYYDSYRLYYEKLSSESFALRIILLIIMYIFIYIIYYYAYGIYKVFNPMYHFFINRLNDLIISVLLLLNYIINNEGITSLDLAIMIFEIFIFLFYIIGSMVYLEFIELNFCDLNKYTKRNIKIRADTEIQTILEDIGSDDD